MCPSVLNFLVVKGNVAQYFLVAKGNIAHGANSTYQTSLWCLRNRKRHAVAEKFAQLQFWFRAILFCEENERDKHHNYQGFKNSKFTCQILFPFSQRQKNWQLEQTKKTQPSPVSSSIFVGESEENLFGNEPDKSAFRFKFDHLEKYKFYSGTKVERRNCFFPVGSCWVFIANIFVSPHQQTVLQSTTFRPGCPSHFQVSNRKRKCQPF